MTHAAATQPKNDANGDKNAIRPFHINIPEEALVDLRRRIAATKWPERELVSDATQGVQLATMQKLAHYWATDYDWRKAEAKLNSYPQFVTEHRRSRHPFHSRSFEKSERSAGHRHARMARLDHRAVEDHWSAHRSDGAWWKSGRRVRRCHSLAAGLRVFRKADSNRLGSPARRARLGRSDEPPRI